MAMTNFSRLTAEEKTIWARQIWHHARNYAFLNKFTGEGANSVVQRVTDLRKTEKGARAVITLVTDLEQDGVVGDNQLEGMEESQQSFDQVITIDQLRHAVRHEGKMAEQRSVVNFRSHARDSLAYWLSERLDQLAFLTMSGVSYAMQTNGVLRPRSNLPDLDFASKVTPPTDDRRFRWNSASKTLEVGGATSDLMPADRPTWQLFVDAKAAAKDRYIRPVRGSNGTEMYHAFLTPQAMARLKMDPDYMHNLRHAQERANGNPLFTGSSVEIDGIVLHEYRHVYNTSGAPVGDKWGNGSVDGCQILFTGGQALGFADINDPDWVEEEFDYENQQGISVAKIFGMHKPQFVNPRSGHTKQDFGVMSIYVAV